MIDICRTKPKVVDSIDLTTASKSGPAKPLSSKMTDTIIKVLDDFDSEPITLKDSDSDVEILPTSPSPTPDIKVDRVNSLKIMIDTTENYHPSWLDNL